MKTVLVACEYSGIVRDAFEDAGWDAWSCDLLPTESEKTIKAGKHLQEDILRILAHNFDGYYNLPNHWDLLIGFPPCTYLSFAYTGKERYSLDRLQNKIDAMQFFLDLWKQPIAHICLENPMGYIHSGLLPYSQIIEPYYFGHNYRKKTCLWLKNLPLLQHSKNTNLFEKQTHYEGEIRYYINGWAQRRSGKKSIADCYDNKMKSKFHPLVAAAMAKQWTEYINNKINKYE